MPKSFQFIPVNGDSNTDRFPRLECGAPGYCVVAPIGKLQRSNRVGRIGKPAPGQRVTSH